MTQLSQAQDVEIAVRQSHFVTARDAQYHRDLAIEVYRQIFDRFGQVPDVLLIELAYAPVEQLSLCSPKLYESRSLEEFVSRVGWAIPQGGEGNFRLDILHRAKRLSFEERRQCQERLASLRKAQGVHSEGVPASLRPEPLPDSRHFARAKRASASRCAVAPTPAEILALKYEQDPLSRAYLQRAACARTEGQSHGYHEGTQGTLVAVLHTQLEQRFGMLPDWAEARIEGASLTQLFDWVKSVIHADTLESALDSEAQHPAAIPL